MRTKDVKRPKTYRNPNSVSRAGVITYGPSRFGSGKYKGQIVPTRKNPVKTITCARCKLPSFKGLPPFVRALGFHPDTGESVEVYVHQGCPGEPEKIAKDIEEIRVKWAEEAERKRKTNLTRSRIWRPGRW